MQSSGFLAALFNDLDGAIELRPILDLATGEELPDGLDRATDWKHRRWFDSWEELDAKLPKLCEWGRRQRRALFFGVLPRTQGGGKASDCLPGRAAWVDIDWKQYEGGETEARERLGKFGIQPSIVVRSAHGLHAYWLLSQTLPPAQLSDLSRRLAHQFGGDAAFDAARLLRLPGSWNCKDPTNPIRVEVEVMRSGDRIQPEALGAALPVLVSRGSTRVMDSAPMAPSTMVTLASGRAISVADIQSRNFRDTGGDFDNGKAKIACPFQADASPGSAFLRITASGGVLIHCGSRRHTHWVQDQLKKWWCPAPGGEEKPRAKGVQSPQTPDSAEQDVWNQLDVTRLGTVRPSLLNIRRVLEGDTRWAGRVWFNELDGRVYIHGAPMTDPDIADARKWMDEHYQLRPSKSDMADEIEAWSRVKRRHPLRERMIGLEWDTTTRCENLLPRYFGADDTPLNREIGKRWMISAVARIFDPGCKVDTVLILVGPQGALKSSAFNTLALNPEWFCDTAIDFRRGNDAYEKLRGVWIYELAELSGVRRSDVESVKAFISSRRDRFREAYARCVTENPRQCVFVGTTNEVEFLSDGTGSRRFWPVTIGAIDLPALRSDVEQLWAEARTFYQTGDRWWLEDGTDAQSGEYIRYGDELAASSSVHQSGDPWASIIEVFVEDRFTSFTVIDVADRIGKKVETLTRSDQMRIAGVLQSLGCKKTRTLVDGNRVRQWTPPNRVITGGK
mgnify:CR=1 FL=1